MQRSQLKRAHCRTCNKPTKFERHVTAMGCGDLVMVIGTCGLWLIARHLFTPDFVCTECGSK